MIVLPVVLVLALCAPAQENPVPIRFEQSIYVVAKRIDNSNLDLSVEAKARSEFEKRKKFTVAKSSANADFVFLLLTEYDSYSGGVLTGNTTSIAGVGSSYNYVKSITGVVIPAKEYSERKDDLEKLREVALWQGAVTAGMREASAPNLVKRFYEHVGKQKGSAK